jgi:hypothetical protein
MKTTNFEISKKLKEAGFKAETDYYWVECEEGIICVNAYVFSDYMSGGEKLCESFDLETILDALPIYIMKEYKDRLSGKFINYVAELTISKYLHSSYIIEYRCYNIVPNLENTDVYFDRIFSCFTENESLFTENVSLADAAGSMWLKIKEKNLL